MCMSCQLQQLLQTSNRFIHKTMSIGIGDNFNYQGSKFNMDRDSFQTKEAMKNYPETSLPPKGFRTYCAEDDEYYEFNAGNSVDPDTGKWRMVDNPTAKKTVEDAKTNGDYAKEQGDAAKEAARKVTNDVLFKVFQSLTEEEQTQVKQNIGIGVEQKFQGQFESYSELEGVSSPAVGDYAYVGNPRNLYAYKSSGWANLGAFNYNIDQELDAVSERGIANGVVTKELLEVRYGFIKDYFINGSDGNVVKREGLCYIDIPYSEGDVIEVASAVDPDGGIGNNASYNFYNDDSFLGGANNLDSIPPTTNHIKVNSNYVSKNGIEYVLINGKPYNIFSRVYENEKSIEYINDNIGIHAGYYDGRFINKNDGKVNEFHNTCYIEFSYSEGDDVEILNAATSGAYDRYNFFNGDTFISTSNSTIWNTELIPENCNKIKVNGVITNLPIAIVNGKGVNNYSESCRLSDKIDSVQSDLNSIDKELSSVKSDLYDSFDSLITDYGIEDLFQPNNSEAIVSVDDNYVYSVICDNNTGGRYVTSKTTYFDTNKVKAGRKIACYVDIEFVTFPVGVTWSFGVTNDRKSISSIKQGERRKFIYKTEYTGNEEIANATLFILVAPGSNLNDNWSYKIYQAAVIDCGTDSSNPLYNLSEDEILKLLGNNPKVIDNKIQVLKTFGGTEGITRNSNEFEFKDEDENIVARLNKNELRVNNVLNLKGEELFKFLNLKLEGKEFFTVGDSLCSEGSWQPKFAALTGAIFDKNYNRNNISVGGTTTLGASIYSGQNRLKKLIEEKTPEIIILENINDFTTDIDDSDYSYMIEATTISAAEYDDASSARSAKITEINSIPSQNRSIGHALRIGYASQNGKKLIITGTSTIAKTATVRVGSTSASINIENGDTAANVIAKIYEVYWAGYDKFTDNSTYVAFVNTDGGTADVGLHNLDGNGITVSQDTYASTSYINYYYIGQSTDDDTFQNSSNWVETVPISAAYKGVFEYIYSKLPNCRVIWFIPTRMPIQWTENENGWDENLWLEKGIRVNMNYYKNSYSQKVNYDTFRAFQREVAELYGAEVYDINEECGINPYNHKTFYPSYNVHPLQAGYDRFAETLARMLK